MALLTYNNTTSLTWSKNNDVLCCWCLVALPPFSYTFSWCRKSLCVFIFCGGGRAVFFVKVMNSGEEEQKEPHVDDQICWTHIECLEPACKNGVWVCNSSTHFLQRHIYSIPLFPLKKRCSLIQKVVSSFKTLLLFPTFKSNRLTFVDAFGVCKSQISLFYSHFFSQFMANRTRDLFSLPIEAFHHLKKNK